MTNHLHHMATLAQLSQRLNAAVHVSASSSRLQSLPLSELLPAFHLYASKSIVYKGLVS